MKRVESLEKNNKFSFKKILINGNLILIIIVLMVVSTILSPVFLTPANIFNLFRQLTPYFLITIGMLFVILTGNIDLSQGATMALGGVMVAVALTNWNIGQTDPVFSPILIMLIAVAVGVGSGFITGFLVARLQMMSFVATLAMGLVNGGIAYMITDGHPIRVPQDSLAGQTLLEFGAGGISGFHWPIILVIVVIAVFSWLLKFTAFGRLCQATGSNSSAVLLAGQNVQKFQLSSFVISGGLSALAGAILVTRAAVAAPNAGTGYELDAIAACVIGGASLAGGKGTVLQAIIGMLIIGLIGNILDLLSVPAFPQKVIKGVIIIAAVLMQMATSQKRKVN
jgi:ribose transport system permease protein